MGDRLTAFLRAACILLAVGFLVGGAFAGQLNAEPTGDAAGDVALATTLPGPGSYFGRLSDATDVDAFRSASALGGVGCVQLRAEATKWAQATLRTVGGGAAHRISTPVPPGSAASPRIGLAYRAADHAGIELRAIPDPSTGAAAEGGPYSFDLAILPRAQLGPGDAGTGRDAGSTFSESLPAAGLCTGGEMGGIDAADIYSFELAQGQQIVYSLASNSTATLTVEILNAAGHPVGPAAINDGIATAMLPEAGLYYAAVTMGSSPDTSYVLALVGPDPPPGNPCRPTCHVS